MTVRQVSGPVFTYQGYEEEMVVGGSCSSVVEHWQIGKPNALGLVPSSPPFFQALSHFKDLQPKMATLGC